jgi:superfamily II DNA helicase RecQ
VLVALQEWRQRTARAAQVAPHVVCHDATLAALAAARPSTPSELLAVPGFGAVKAARYGDALLALVATAKAG